MGYAHAAPDVASAAKVYSLVGRVVNADVRQVADHVQLPDVELGGGDLGKAGVGGGGDAFSEAVFAVCLGFGRDDAAFCAGFCLDFG